MSLLLLLLPVALAGLPPHHQKLVDRFGAEHVTPSPPPPCCPCWAPTSPPEARRQIWSPPCHSFSSSSLLPLLGSHLTTRSSSTDLEQKMSTLTRMSEQPSATLAWKSQSKAMEEPRSINPTGSAGSQEMGLFGRTWFPSGLQTTLSTSPLIQCPTL